MNENFGPNYDEAAGILVGIFAEGDGIYNYNRSGASLAQGTPISRRFAVNDYEFYGQDTWRMTPRLTVSYGLRWVLEAPPYETNGLQVAPCVAAAGGGCTNQNLADWFNNTAKLAAQGMPANNAGEISFELGGPKNNGPGLWNWDHKDFSPRIAVAWAPDTGDGWVSKILGKKDEFSIRGGYSIMYDHFGIPIVNSFDQHGSFGLSTDLGNPAGVVTVANAPRFTCLTPGTSGPILLACSLPEFEQSRAACSDPRRPAVSRYAKQYRFCHQLGAGPDLEDPVLARASISRSRGKSTRKSSHTDSVCGHRRPASAYAGRSGDACQSDGSRHAKRSIFRQLPSFRRRRLTARTLINPTHAILRESVSRLGGRGDADSLGEQAARQRQRSLNCAGGKLPANPTATQNIYELWNCFPHNETFDLFLLDLPDLRYRIESRAPEQQERAVQLLP